MEPDPDMGRPGEPIASGRAAEVFALPDGTVLRRYRERVRIDTADEARVMRWVAEQGIRVPRVHAASGRDLVMERIEGPTMLEDLGRRPWRLLHHARLLAELQRDIDGLRAPDWVRRDDRVPAGDALLHLDLHPMNVLLSPEGPVVIDWTNARRGDPWFDAALSYAVMSTAEADAASEVAGRRAFVGAFALRRGRLGIRAQLRRACEYRLEDPAVTEHEREALQRLAARGIGR